MTKPQEACAYCGGLANEREHVLAKQFSPPEQIYRGDPVLVPACTACNRAKQRAEDAAGVLIPFTGGGLASAKLLDNRVPRTLAKNAKLAKSLENTLKISFIEGRMASFKRGWS